MGWARRRSTLLLMIAIAAASVPLLATPARADDFAPEILAFERTSEGLLGGHQAITIEFTARDEGPAGLEYAMFTFATPLGGQVRVDSPSMRRAAEGTFVAIKLMSPWAASGDYRLDLIEVYDREGNKRSYERASSPQLDMPAADFRVDNPNEDTTVPTIESARLFQDDVAQGTPVVVLYDARDDRSGVSKVVFTGWSPTRGQYWVESLPELGAAGPASWLVPFAAATGTYDSFGILVEDRAGNTLWYSTGEEDRPYPPRASVPAHEGADPGSLDFVVHGAAEDTTPPEMTELAPRTGRARHLGDVVGLDYSAFDHGVGIRQVTARWIDGKGHSIEARRTCGDLSSGVLSVTIEDFRTVGSEWQLEYVSFDDHLNNQTGYIRDGRVIYQGGDSGPPTHSFDLSQGDFTIEPGGPSDEDVPDTTVLYCPRIGGVSLGLDDTDVVYGDVVTTAGTITAGEAPVEDPLVVVHEHLAAGPELVGVVQGDGGGEYATSFVARENAQVTATFLGADGPAGAEPATSRKVRLRVRPRLHAALDDERIPGGTATQIRGRLVPATKGSVVLQLRTDDGWRTVARKTLRGSGAFTLDVPPPGAGRFTYRVTKPARGALSAGRSRALILRVVPR